MPADLRSVKNFPQLLRYLRDELLWPIETADAEEITFEYTTADFAALAPDHHVQIEKILQLRPLVTGQPWGIFYVQFKKARLPVVVLRELLASLVFKKRASANKAERPAWECHDLLFISSYGEDADHRHLNFAHFSDTPNGSHLPALRVLDWDGDDTDRALERLDSTLHEKLRWPEDDTNLDRWREQWSAAFRRGLRHPIKKAEQLAHALAVLAQNIRGSVLKQMEVESERGKLRILHAAFKSALIHDLEAKQFADMFAQTIAYGLFTQATRRTVAGGGTAITADGAVDSVTSLSPFLRDLLSEFLNVGGRRRSGLDYDKLGVNEVVDLLNAKETDLAAVLDDFGHKKRDEDPVIHFYETFLAAYDKAEKIKRGVFYTPQSVVSYIVRSVHELLQTEFGLPLGLASTVTWGEMVKKLPGLAMPNLSDDPDPKKARLLPEAEFFVQVLDPATGTATFLVETIDVIYRHLKKTWEEKGGLLAMPEIHAKPAGSKPPRTFADYWQLYVPTSLLPRLYGYELMMAPYAIAHMKIALKLADTGFTAWKDLGLVDRVHIYLTNALEPKLTQLPQIGFDALAHEANAVKKIKWDKRFTVVIGNPPYTVMSANLSEEARSLVNPYRFVDGARIKEKSMLRLEMHLQDDYIKFFRIGQTFIEVARCGLFGYVSNHSFLVNPTLRGMRQNLMNSFSKLWFYDLHGNSKKKDDAPEGADDKNVFDIQQGVAISLAVRFPEKQSQNAVRHSDLFGPRDTKYRQLTMTSVSGTPWADLQPSSPIYLFVPQDATLRSEFDQAVGLLDMMPLNSCGVVSGREALTYDFDKAPLEERMSIFCNPKYNDDWIREKFDISDAGGYELTKRRKTILGEKASSFTQHIDVRPFDTRWVAYTRGVLTSDQSNVMSHMLRAANIGLIATRQTKETWGVMVTRRPIAHKAVSAYDVSSLFPLLIQPESGTLNISTEAIPNLSPSFLRTLAAIMNMPQQGAHGLPTDLTPEVIFQYAYAVFYSPGYRNRYAGFLKKEYPRLPLVRDLGLFQNLALLGGELVALHLLESPLLDTPRTKFIGSTKRVIEKISYTDETIYIDKAQTAGFVGVPRAVWEFHIGGYQVCDKWLEDRRKAGRTLSADDIDHYHKIILALTETIRLMQEIDEVIEEHGGFPDAFAAVAPTAQTGATTTAAKSVTASDQGLSAEDELPLA